MPDYSTRLCDDCPQNVTGLEWQLNAVEGQINTSGTFVCSGGFSGYSSLDLGRRFAKNPLVNGLSPAGLLVKATTELDHRPDRLGLRGGLAGIDKKETSANGITVIEEQKA